MFVFDPLIQGLQFLGQRELQRAENLFLSVINDPYAEPNDSKLARQYLNDIRSCQRGSLNPDFSHYRSLAKGKSRSFDNVILLLFDLYFSDSKSFQEFDQVLTISFPTIIGQLKRLKVKDILSRDELIESMEKTGLKRIHELLKQNGEGNTPFDSYRWKTIFRKFVAKANPILLERHLELLEYILESGEIHLLDDQKLTTLTPKYRWIIESTIKSKWYLLRSYFFKAKIEIQEQFSKKKGTRKYWEEIKYKKIKIFEECGFHEKHIQKFLYSDKLNYKTLLEIHEYSRKFSLKLAPRDISLALRGLQKAKNHIKERAGWLTGKRKDFQEKFIKLGFSRKNAYQIAKQAKCSNGEKIAETYKECTRIACDEIYWYRVQPDSIKLLKDLEEQCLKHLSTARIHLFERGRLNKLLLQSGKSMIRNYLIRAYGEGVLNLHCYFRLETIHQYYKLKFFQYHADSIPSVSELIKVSRKDFKAMVIQGYSKFVKKRRLLVSNNQLSKLETYNSKTEWEDRHTTPEEKFLLKAWFLMDHGVSVTQGLIKKGVMAPGFNLLDLVDLQEEDCKS